MTAAFRLRSLLHVMVVLLVLGMAGSRLRHGPPSIGGAGGFPSKPIEVVVPYDAGGGTDTLARLAQQAIAAKGLLRQPMVIINQPGGSGTIGSRYVRDSKPDGYRILCLDETIITSRLSGTVNFGPEAFEPIAQACDITMVVTVRADAPFASLRELLESAAVQPGAIRFGVVMGSPGNFAVLELEATLPEAKFNLLQSGGGQKRYALLLGGHIDVGIFSLAEYVNYHAGPDAPPDRQIRALSILGAERHPDLAHVPTAREQGIEVVTGNSLYWWAPKGTPEERVAILAQAFEEAIGSPEMKARFRALSIDPQFRRGAALQRWIDRRVEAFSAVVPALPVELPDFPRYAAGLLGALGGLLLLQRLRPAAVRPDAPAIAGADDRLRAALCAALLILYVLLLELRLVAYAVATTGMIFLAGLLIAGRERRRPLVLAELAFLVGFGTEWVFARFLKIVLS